MYSKELTARSPLRIFKRSLHGGLGKGNIGVVFSRAGVGKTAFLIGVALDDLLQGKQVLHVAIDDSVDHVREFYDQVFNDLAISTNLADRAGAHHLLERNRYIHTFRGGSFSLSRVRDALASLKEHQQFEPVLVIIDGYPSFEDDRGELVNEMRELKELAAASNAELWLSALSHRHDSELDERGVPHKITSADETISVLVSLEPKADHVKLRLAKDHQNMNVADLHLQLDPTSLLLKWM